MKIKSDNKISYCKEYQVIEEGHTFWCLNDFFPDKPKTCERQPPTEPNTCKKRGSSSKRRTPSKSRGANSCTACRIKSEGGVNGPNKIESASSCKGVQKTKKTPMNTSKSVAKILTFLRQNPQIKMKIENDNKTSYCKKYQVIEEGHTFWCLHDFYPDKRKVCEKPPPSEPCTSEKRRSSSSKRRSPSKCRGGANSCTACRINSDGGVKKTNQPPMNSSMSVGVCEVMQNSKKNKKCKRTASVGSKRCTPRHSSQTNMCPAAEMASRRQSHESLKTRDSQSETNNDCVLIMPPERQSNGGRRENNEERQGNDEDDFTSNVTHESATIGNQSETRSSFDPSANTEEGKSLVSIQSDETNNYTDNQAPGNQLEEEKPQEQAPAMYSSPDTSKANNQFSGKLNNNQMFTFSSDCTQKEDTTEENPDSQQQITIHINDIQLDSAGDDKNYVGNVPLTKTPSAWQRIVLDVRKPQATENDTSGTPQPKWVKLCFQVFMNGNDQLALENGANDC